MNTVFIRGVEVRAVIGVYAWERTAPQALRLDLEIALPDAKACRSDRLEDTVDYAQVVERVREELARKQFALVEAAAERVAQIVLGEFGAHRVKVSIAKLGFMPGVAELGVTMERRAVTDYAEVQSCKVESAIPKLIS